MEKMRTNIPLLVKRALRPVWLRAVARYPGLIAARQRANEALAVALKHRRVAPENLIWIFGVGRSGSTWLLRMMSGDPRSVVWNEPMVGQLFGRYYVSTGQEHLGRPHFILSDARRQVWKKSIRNFVLDGARFVVPASLGPRPYVLIKEPNGSMGAPLLMEALPESRMILLVRDPRDVVASSMDAKSEGGWNYEKNKKLYLEGRRKSSSEDPDAFAQRRAARYLQGMGKAKEAYDAHKGPKVLVRYEELRADTLGTMKRIYSTLGIEVDEQELERVVEEHSWENIPEEEKGEGKFYR